MCEDVLLVVYRVEVVAAVDQTLSNESVFWKERILSLNPVSDLCAAL